MNRRIIQYVAMGFVIAVLGLSLVMIASAGVNAQESPGNASSDQDQDRQNQTREIEEQLGDLSIHSVDFDTDENFVLLTVTWDGRAPTTMSTMELIDPDDGSGSIGIDQTRLRPGERTQIRVALSDRMDGVVVSTPESIEEQNALLLTPDTGDSRQVRLLWGVILGVAIGGAGVAGAALKKQRSSRSVEQAKDKGGLL